MAKLSAYGRKEVYRFCREIDGTTKVTVCLMSDNAILEKTNGLGWSTGWKLRGKLKPEISPESWAANMRKTGYSNA